MNVQRDSELSACVRKMMKQYFHDLDGEGATDIYDMVVANVEKPLLEVVLHHAEGNQTRAAELLGLNRNTLRKKLTQHGIERNRDPKPVTEAGPVRLRVTLHALLVTRHPIQHHSIKICPSPRK